MEETKKEQYQVEYNAFLDEYKAGVTTGEGVGEVIARLAQYFTEANLNHASSLIKFNKVARENEEKVDDNGKAISSSKAKVMAADTVEAAELIVAKAHLENIEQKINALKSLQRGLLNEYSHVGSM